MLRPYQNPTASASTRLGWTLCRFLRRPLLRAPLFAQVAHRGADVVRDLPLRPQGRDDRFGLLGVELERARLRDGLIEQRLLATQALEPPLDFREHRLGAGQALFRLLDLLLAMIEPVRGIVH